MKPLLAIFLVVTFSGCLHLHRRPHLTPPVCQVHNRPMKQQETPVVYATAPYTPEFEREAAVNFPHARFTIYSGYVTGGQKSILIWVCPACEAAYKQYLATHKS